MKKIKREKIIKTTEYQSCDEKFCFETEEDCAEYEILAFVKAYDSNRILLNNTDFEYACDLLCEAIHLIIPVTIKEAIQLAFEDFDIDCEDYDFNIDKSINGYYYLTTVENEYGNPVFKHTQDVITEYLKKADDLIGMTNIVG